MLNGDLAIVTANFPARYSIVLPLSISEAWTFFLMSLVALSIPNDGGFSSPIATNSTSKALSVKGFMKIEPSFVSILRPVSVFSIFSSFRISSGASS